MSSRIYSVIRSGFLQYDRGLSLQLGLTSDSCRTRSRIFSCVLHHYRFLRRKPNNNHLNIENKLSSVVVPVTVKPKKSDHDDDESNIGEELTGTIKKDKLLTILNSFYKRSSVKDLAAENCLDTKLFNQAFLSFRVYCVNSHRLPIDLHVILCDIANGAGHLDDIFPFFLNHAKKTFPHLDCLEDLQEISDIRIPANWYPDARTNQRRIIIHSGPTNSGKTHHALERFLLAKSGVYCGPLKLLASEVYKKSNERGTPCDLVTGEERLFAKDNNEQSSHVACTVEMTSVTTPYEVAIIDEIQMLKDKTRGWAWTRALLGVNAQEIHLCGEEAAIELVEDILLGTGDEIQINKYKRLTKLTYLDYPIENFSNVRPGDCIVCFSKADIFRISRELEKHGHEVAVIYGALPPGTKLAQAERFNDPNDPCKILVATDAIGMGINLSIKRMIFYSLIKPDINEKGEKEMNIITTSQALQIAGRAGRYGTAFEDGEVTTFKRDDLPVLQKVLEQPVDTITRAGLHPTTDQIELFAYHLPNASLSNLIDIFSTISSIDGENYFMCNMDDFKFVADMIQHIPLELRARYTFCCLPIPRQTPFACTLLLKYARQYSRNEPATISWLCQQVGWPFKPPVSLNDLIHLECVFDVLYMYLWLSYRFPDMFPDTQHVRDIQSELDAVIQEGVKFITSLIKANESSISSGTIDNEDDFQIKVKNSQYEHNAVLNRDLTESFKKKKKHLPHEKIELSPLKPGKKYPRVGKIANQLIEEGIMTLDQVKEMMREWAKKKS